ncbi:MAG: ABC transporter ATP-binding protein [Tepidisphaeraceae bacterium]
MNPPPNPTAEPLLKVRGLCKYFVTKPATRKTAATVVKAVDDVSFDVFPGQTLGIVGESGSGKTTCTRAILRAIEPTGGSAIFQSPTQGPVDLVTYPHRKLKPLRREMQMIFQDPFSSLNPRMTVGQIVAEPLVIHGIGSRRQRTEQVVAILERVGLQADHIYRYPHAFSGGQRQRIGIARALILRPSLVVADESVSALDVSVRARVLDMLRDLQKEFGLTYLFVAHDLSVVRSFCDTVAVMYRGRVMEFGDTRSVFAQPRHAYTRVLLSAIPYPDPDRPFSPMSVSDLTEDQLQPLPCSFVA